MTKLQNKTINPSDAMNLLEMYTNMVEGSRWLGTTQYIIAFLPELFFFLSNIFIFLYWFWVIKQEAKRKETFFAYYVERYIFWLIGINILTLVLFLDFPGLPITFGGYASGETLMFQFTYYTQMVKVFTLLLYTFLLYGGQLYFAKQFFPMYVNAQTGVQKINSRFLEYFLIMGFAVGFTFLLVSSINLISVALTMEGLSFCLYILSGFQTQSRYALEAAVKYFFYGAVVFGLFACGMLFIYLEIGGLGFYHILANSPTFYDVEAPVLISHENYIAYNSQKGSKFFMAGVFLLFSALVFKVGGAPFHFWVADVYEGAPYPTTAFMASIGKVGFYSILVKFCAWVFINNIVEWQWWLLAAGAFSLIVGAFGAVMQKRIKRFFAYSSIVHVGFLLITLAIGDQSFLASVLLYNEPPITFHTNAVVGGLLYLFVYVVTVLCVFLILMNFLMRDTGKAPVYFTDLQGLFVRSANKDYEFVLVGVGLVVLIFSMAGIPPFFGFFTKFYVLTFLVKYKFNILTGIVIGTTVLGAFYYLRLLKIFFFEDITGSRRSGLIFLRDFSKTKGSFTTFIHGNYEHSVGFLALFAVFFLIVFPWLGIEWVFQALVLSVGTLCWPELPLVLINTAFISHSIPYLFPFDFQLVTFYLNNSKEMREYAGAILDGASPEALKKFVLTQSDFRIDRPSGNEPLTSKKRLASFLSNWKRQG